MGHWYYMYNEFLYNNPNNLVAQKLNSARPFLKGEELYKYDETYPKLMLSWTRPFNFETKEFYFELYIETSDWWTVCQLEPIDLNEAYEPSGF